MKCISESVFIICSIVRNAERGLKRNIPVMMALCRQCKDYRVIVYENDSKDKTKLLLAEWAKLDPERVHVLLNDTDSSKTIPMRQTVMCNPFFSHKRIDKMAALRNQYMEYVDRQGWKGDYYLVVDLDVAQLSFKGILSSFETNVDWDAVTAFGYSTSPRLRRRYHDTYALTEYGEQILPQTEEKIKSLADRYGKLKPTDEWVRVYSAFGGLAIYKFEAFDGLRYAVFENADKRVEVRCEHYSIYQQMEMKGFNRVYINPAMQLHYQSLTWKIVWRCVWRYIERLLVHT